MNSLVVYYSRTGKTRYVAEQIAECLDAEIEEIIDKTDRSGKFGFLKSAIEAVVEGETKIENSEYSPNDYDLVLLGCPVWARKLPPAMRTYLKKFDLSDKRIALFNTNDSDENQNTFSTMKKLANNENTIDQLVVSKVSKNKEKKTKRIEEWCEEIKRKLEKETSKNA